MYSKCGSLEDSRAVFEGIQQKNVGSWTSMITAYAHSGHCMEAWQFYFEMAIEGVEPAPVTYISLLGASRTIQDGKRIHERVLACGIRNVDVENALVNMYTSFRNLQLACAVFEEMNTRNEFTWTAIISAYAEQGSKDRVLQMFGRMDLDGVEPNEITFSKFLTGCPCRRDVLKQLHIDLSSGKYRLSELVGTCLLDAYAKCGFLGDALMVFQEWESKDCVFWNSMICAYTQACCNKEALLTYHCMSLEGIKPDSCTFSGIIGACTNLGDFKTGEQVRLQAVTSGHDSNIAVRNSILTMLVKCGSLEEASDFFEKMDAKDVVSWTSLIGGYAQAKQPSRALEIYKRMDAEPNVVTYATVLEACCSLGDVQEARSIHSRFKNSGLQSQVVETTLLNMYAKSGFVADARCLFENMISRRDTVAWNAMIGAYAQHCQEQQVLELFHGMILEGEEPTSVTFVSLFVACSGAGLLEECCKYFGSMILDHHLCPVPEHFVCIIDILGRLGMLKEAEKAIQSIPDVPSVSLWRTLLAACKLHNDPDRASRAWDHLDPADGPAMVLISNIYAK